MSRVSNALLIAASSSALLLATLVPATAATSPHQKWKALYNGGASDEGKVVRPGPDGQRVFVTGRSENSTDLQTDLVTVAYTADGAKVWTNRYTADWSAVPNDMIVSPDGTRVYVIAYSYKTQSSDSGDYLTVAYSASDGARLWAARYDDPGHGDDQPHGLAVSPDGSTVYVTGQSFGARTYHCGEGYEYDATDVATVAYSSAGTKLWVHRYDNKYHSSDSGWGIAVDRTTGDVYVAAITEPNCEAQVRVLAYQPDGKRIWGRTLESGSLGDFPVGVAVDGTTGKVFIGAGRFVSAEGTEFLLLAYSTGGDLLWNKTFSGSGATTYPFGFALGPGDHVYLNGETGSTSTPASSWQTVAYDGDGNLLWQSTYKGSVHGGQNWAISVAPSADGTVVFGLGFVDTSLDWAIVAFDATDGHPVWSAPTITSEHSEWLAAAPTGHRAYVTGAEFEQRGIGRYDDDYDTLAFE